MLCFNPTVLVGRFAFNGSLLLRMYMCVVQRYSGLLLKTRSISQALLVNRCPIPDASTLRWQHRRFIVSSWLLRIMAEVNYRWVWGFLGLDVCSFVTTLFFPIIRKSSKLNIKIKKIHSERLYTYIWCVHNSFKATRNGWTRLMIGYGDDRHLLWLIYVSCIRGVFPGYKKTLILSSVMK